VADFEGGVLCAKCEATRERREAPALIRSLFRGLAGGMLGSAAILFTQGVLLPLLLLDERVQAAPLVWAGIGAAVCLPLLLSALLAWLAHSLAAAWAGVVVQLGLAALQFAAMPRPSLWWFAEVLLGFFGLVQVLRVGVARSELRKAPPGDAPR
jgi:hypothetical protein